MQRAVRPSTTSKQHAKSQKSKTHTKSLKKISTKSNKSITHRSSSQLSQQSTSKPQQQLIRQSKRFQATVPIKDFVSPFPTTTTGQGLSYKLFFFDGASDTSDVNNAISPWHDISLLHSASPRFHPTSASAPQSNSIPVNNPHNDLIFNFVCEIPRGTLDKFEIHTKSANNPIQQDVKNGQLRKFKYGKIPFNYGALPQTWENPKHIDSMMKLGGDNDPVDVVELSPGPLQHGAVYPVKVVGALALIDEGEVDWKILAIDANHPVAPKLKDVNNLDAFLPGFEAKLKDWFKNYKTAEGKGQNHFGYNDHLLNKTKAIEIIKECHESWAHLCQQGDKNEHGLAVKALPSDFVPANLQ